MSVFGKYSSYYDLLYKDKDYQAEADFVYDLLQQYNPNGSSVLELGCGSGGHALKLAEKGLSLHGVDMSNDMLQIANSQAENLPAELAGKLSFSQGDIRQLELGKTFANVISLFHVISYMPTLEDILAVFNRVYTHLESSGVFVFDIWYAPAVLTQKPEVRVKRMRNNDIAVTRIAEPVWHPNECWVDVCYKVFIEDLKTSKIDELETEVHRMRYLSLPEIKLLASLANLEVITHGEWLTNKSLDETTWGAYFVVRKN